jgi:DNA-binding MarR family transcriptional regulator
VSRPELLVEGDDAVFRGLVHDALAFSARIQAVRAQLGELIGLSGSQYTILITIAHREDGAGVGVNAVAEHLHLSGAFVTIEVNKLLAARLVAKETNPDDRRRVLLTTTPKARRLLGSLAKVQAPVNDALFAPLTREEFEVVSAVMSRLVEAGDRALNLIAQVAPEAPVDNHECPQT